MGNLDFYRLPFPNDIRLKAGKVDLTGHPKPGATLLPFDLVERYLGAIAAETTGFGANQAMYLRFSRQIDTANFPGDCGATLVDITPTSPDFGLNVGLTCSASNGHASYICGPFMVVRPPAGAPAPSGHDLRLAGGQADPRYPRQCLWSRRRLSGHARAGAPRRRRAGGGLAGLSAAARLHRRGAGDGRGSGHGLGLHRAEVRGADGRHRRRGGGRAGATDREPGSLRRSRCHLAVRRRQARGRARARLPGRRRRQHGIHHLPGNHAPAGVPGGNAALRDAGRGRRHRVRRHRGRDAAADGAGLFLAHRAQGRGARLGLAARRLRPRHRRLVPFDRGFGAGRRSGDRERARGARRRRRRRRPERAGAHGRARLRRRPARLAQRGLDQAGGRAGLQLPQPAGRARQCPAGGGRPARHSARLARLRRGRAVPTRRELGMQLYGHSQGGNAASLVAARPVALRHHRHVRHRRHAALHPARQDQAGRRVRGSALRARAKPPPRSMATTPCSTSCRCTSRCRTA